MSSTTFTLSVSNTTPSSSVPSYLQPTDEAKLYSDYDNNYLTLTLTPSASGTLGTSHPVNIAISEALLKTGGGVSASINEHDAQVFSFKKNGNYILSLTVPSSLPFSPSQTISIQLQGLSAVTGPISNGIVMIQSIYSGTTGPLSTSPVPLSIETTPVVLSITNVAGNLPTSGFTQNSGAYIFGGFNNNALQLNLTTKGTYNIDLSKSIEVLVPQDFFTTTAGIVIGLISDFQFGDLNDVTPTTSGSYYKFVLGWKTPSLTLSSESPVEIQLYFNAAVPNGPIVGQNIIVKNLYYTKSILGRDESEELTVNPVSVSVLKATPSKTTPVDANFDLSSSTANDESIPYTDANGNPATFLPESTNNIYPSLMNDDNLVVPLANTIKAVINWENNTAASASNAGELLLWFDYGSGYNMYPNQLCTNLPTGTATFGLSVFDWPTSSVTLQVTQYSGSTVGEGTSTDISTNWSITRGASNNGAWAIAPANDSYQAPWNKAMNFTLTFDKVVSGNSLTGQAETNLYVQSSGITGLVDTVGLKSFTLIPSIPQVVSLPSSIDSDAFEIVLFGAAAVNFNWQNNDGLNNTIELSTIQPASQILGDIGSSSEQVSWSLIYQGTVTGITTNQTSTPLDVYGINSGGLYGNLQSTSIGNSGAITTPTIDSFVVLCTVMAGDTTFALLQWKVTGLGENGYCTLTGETTKLYGSLDGGLTPYTYLYDVSKADFPSSTNVFSVSIKLTATIPSTPSSPAQTTSQSKDFRIVNVTNQLNAAAGTLPTLNYDTGQPYKIFATNYGGSQDFTAYGTTTGNMPWKLAVDFPHRALLTSDAVLAFAPDIDVASTSIGVVKDAWMKLSINLGASSGGTTEYAIGSVGYGYVQMDDNYSIGAITGSNTAQLNSSPYFLDKLNAGLLSDRATHVFAAHSQNSLYGVSLKNEPATSSQTTLKGPGTTPQDYPSIRYTPIPCQTDKYILFAYTSTNNQLVLLITDYSGGNLSPDWVYYQYPLPVTGPITVQGLPKMVWDGTDLHLFYVDNTGAGMLNWYKSTPPASLSTTDLSGVSWTLVSQTSLISNDFSPVISDGTLYLAQLLNGNIATYFTDTSTIAWQNNFYGPSGPFGQVMDICYLDGTFYLPYINFDSVYIFSSQNGAEWTYFSEINSIPSSEYLLTGCCPSITTDGNLLYVSLILTTNSNFQNLSTYNSVYSSEDGVTWTHTPISLISGYSPSYPIQSRYLNEEQLKGASAAGMYGVGQFSGPNGYILKTSGAGVEILSDVGGGMTFAYFRGDYYVAYRNTSGNLSVVRNSTLTDASYSSAGIHLPSPAPYISGQPQLVVLSDKMILIYADVITKQLYYITTQDGVDWSTSPIAIDGVFATAFGAAAFEEGISIGYIYVTGNASLNIYGHVIRATDFTS